MHPPLVELAHRLREAQHHLHQHDVAAVLLAALVRKGAALLCGACRLHGHAGARPQHRKQLLQVPVHAVAAAAGQAGGRATQVRAARVFGLDGQHSGRFGGVRKQRQGRRRRRVAPWRGVLRPWRIRSSGSFGACQPTRAEPLGMATQLTAQRLQVHGNLKRAFIPSPSVFAAQQWALLA